MNYYFIKTIYFLTNKKRKVASFKISSEKESPRNKLRNQCNVFRTEITQIAEQKLNLDKGAAKALADEILDGSEKGSKKLEQILENICIVAEVMSGGKIASDMLKLKL